MEEVGKMARAAHKQLENGSTQSQNRTSPNTGLPRHWVTEIFKRFQGRYLTKFTYSMEGIEEHAVNEWSQRLAGLNGDQIRRGLDDWDGDWPPTADEFRACCLGRKHGKNGFGLNYTPQCYRAPSRERLLESDDHKRRRKKAAKKAVTRMKDAIHGRTAR